MQHEPLRVRPVFQDLIRPPPGCSKCAGAGGHKPGGATTGALAGPGTDVEGLSRGALTGNVEERSGHRRMEFGREHQSRTSLFRLFFLSSSHSLTLFLFSFPPPPWRTWGSVSSRGSDWISWGVPLTSLARSAKCACRGSLDVFDFEHMLISLLFLAVL